MNIGIDISQSVYHGTGVASYTRNLVKTLLTVDQVNHYVLFGSTLRRQNDLGGLIQTLPPGSSYASKIFFFPPTVLEFMWNKLHMLTVESFVGPVDVFHTSDWTEPPARAPKVTTIHDVVVYRYPEFLNRRIIDTQKAKLAWVKKETVAVIADSKSTKEDIVTYLGIPEHKIHVVYLGVSKVYFPQKIDAIKQVRKKYGIQGEYILSVGTREPRKNLPRVIKAFENLAQKDLQLLIVGNAGWGEELTQKNDNITVLENVPVAELASLYSGATCFVYPSLYEGFGLPIIEAMACGTVVVTSKRGSLAEIAGPATTVDPESTVEIAEGIEAVLKLPYTKRKQLIEKGIKHTKEFMWEKTARKTLEVYKSVV